MKTRLNLALRELRKIIGQNQTEFAAMIGASKDTTANWKIWRSNLSPALSRRIAFTKSVDVQGSQLGPIFHFQNHGRCLAKEVLQDSLCRLPASFLRSEDQCLRPPRSRTAFR